MSQQCQSLATNLGVVICPFVAGGPTVTGVRRASGKLDKDATVQTYRHYLLDARFGVLLEGSVSLSEEVAAALRNPPCLPIRLELPDRTLERSKKAQRSGRRRGCAQTVNKYEISRSGAKGTVTP